MSEGGEDGQEGGEVHDGSGGGLLLLSVLESVYIGSTPHVASNVDSLEVRLFSLAVPYTPIQPLISTLHLLEPSGANASILPVPLHQRIGMGEYPLTSRMMTAVSDTGGS